jgi:hypothetical protein
MHQMEPAILHQRTYVFFVANRIKPFGKCKAKICMKMEEIYICNSDFFLFSHGSRTKLQEPRNTSAHRLKIWSMPFDLVKDEMGSRPYALLNSVGLFLSLAKLYAQQCVIVFLKPYVFIILKSGNILPVI